jgi:hypothetical protein
MRFSHLTRLRDWWLGTSFRPGQRVVCVQAAEFARDGARVERRFGVRVALPELGGVYRVEAISRGRDGAYLALAELDAGAGYLAEHFRPAVEGDCEMRALAAITARPWAPLRPKRRKRTPSPAVPVSGA